jgi:D-alanine-D-alanine ligase
MMQFLSKRHDVTPIYITKEGAWLTGSKLTDLSAYKGLNPHDPGLAQVAFSADTGLRAIQNPIPHGLLDKPRKLDLDVIFVAMHGMNGEDGTLQGLLELADLPYVGSGVLASAICMDKVMTKVVLRGYGIPVLDFVSFSRAEWEKDEDGVVSHVESRLSYPVIIKPAHLGSSIGIEKAANRDDLKFNISVATHFDMKILVEPYIEGKLDVNCSVMGNADPIPSVLEQPVSKEALLTFADKYLQNKSERGMEGAKRIIPAPLSPEMTEQIQGMAVEAYKSIGCLGLARIDFLLDPQSQKVYLNEVNTLPGSMAFYLWEPAGIPPEELVDRLVNLAVAAHDEKSRTTYTSNNALLQSSDFLGLKKA